LATTVVDDREKGRYELLVDDVHAGQANYELGADRITIFHVEVDHEQSGRGLGRVLVDAVLADARLRGLGVVPVCPFTRKVIVENQEAYLDLVPADARDEFALPE
jgi:uncharacterized protein